MRLNHVSVARDAVDNLVAFAEELHHLDDGVGVVLEVGVDADGGVTLVAHRHEARKEHLLMAAVVGQRDTFDAGVGGVEVGDNLPCSVARAVVAAQHVALGRDESVGAHHVENLQHTGHGDRQGVLLIIAGNHNGYDGLIDGHERSGINSCGR